MNEPEIPSCSALHQSLQNSATEVPDHISFTFLEDGENNEINITFKELEQRAKAIAATLQETSKPGDRVLMIFPPGLDFIAGLYGCFYAGVIAVPLYPPQPGRLRQTLPQFVKTAQDADAKIILCNQRVYSKKTAITLIAKGLRGFKWINISKIKEEKGETWKEPEVKPEDIALLMYTSGSTGNPKGVTLTHDNLIQQLYSYKEVHKNLDYKAHKDVGVSWVPPYHITGLLLGTLYPVYLGNRNVIMSPLDFLARPLRWLKAISRYRASVSGGPNFAYELCLQEIGPEDKKSLDLSNWNLAMGGGEVNRADTFNRFAKAFAPCGFRPEAFAPSYGLTEAGMMISTHWESKVPRTLSQMGQSSIPENKERKHAENSSISCGQLLSGFSLKIVNPETLRTAEPGEIGEIWVSGPCIAQGYWRRPEETQETFKAYLADTQEGPFLRTGDLGVFEENELFITGRLKEMIIIRGVNYYPGDIEDTVQNAHPSLRRGCGAAFALNVAGEERLIIVQEADSLPKNEIQEVFGKIKAEISSNFQVQVHEIVLIKPDTIPRTESKKIKRFSCRDLLQRKKLKVIAQWSSRDHSKGDQDPNSSSIAKESRQGIS